MTLSRELSDWIEQNCIIGQGRLAGQPLTLLPWQRRFLRGAFAPDVSSAALTMARGGGKSTLNAAIGAAALSGPLAQRGADCLVVAAGFEQAGVIFRHSKRFLAAAIAADPKRYRVNDSANKLFISDRKLDTRLIVHGFNARTLHGSAPAIAILDELAQWQATQIDAALAAVRTGLGKIPDSRMLAIGTRADSEDHPFERMLEGSAGYSQVHKALETDAPFQRRTWRKANPSLDIMPDLEREIRIEAKEARQDSNLLPSFQALRLNMGVSDHAENLLLDSETWRRIEGVAERRGPYILGVDLGSNSSHSGAAAFWPLTGALDCFAVVPEMPSLAARGLSDGVGSAYVRMGQRGELIQRGERVSDPVGLLRDAYRRWGRPIAIVGDRWRDAELRQALDACAFPLAALESRGMGFKDGAEDVRLFRRACIAGEVTPSESLLLRAAVGGARVEMDAAGNAKLTKRGMKGRDDAAQAAIFAVAEGVRRRERGGLTAPRMRLRFAGE